MILYWISLDVIAYKRFNKYLSLIRPIIRLSCNISFDVQCLAVVNY